MKEFKSELFMHVTLQKSRELLQRHIQKTDKMNGPNSTNPKESSLLLKSLL